MDASQGGRGRQVGSPVDRHSIVKTWRSEAPPGRGRTPDELTVVTTNVWTAMKPMNPVRLSRGGLPRRSVLAGAALATVGAITSCGTSRPANPRHSSTAGLSTKSPSSPTPSATTNGSTTPASVDWNALAHGLDGRLLRPGDQPYSAAARLYNPRFDGLNPLAVVQAASADDVVTALEFAARSGLLVHPRSGGHSYVGASAARHAIQIDVRRLFTVRFDAASQTITVGAGASLLSVHTALAPHGRTVPTGTCATVGAAGLTLGGGLGVEDRAYGLTCDALESVTLVTASGQAVTASSKQHPDLFWACRGGGGGNFGVATEFRYGTFPAHPMSTYYLRWDDASTEAVIAGWQQRVHTQPATAWANLHLDTSSGHVVPAVFGVTLDGRGEAEANALVAVVGHGPAARAVTTRSHQAGVLALAGCSERTIEQCRLVPRGALPREISVAGSDVLGRPLSSAEVRGLAHLMRARAAAQQQTSVIVDPLGGAVARVDPAATAFPWRRAFATVQWYVGFPRSPSARLVAATYDWIDYAHHAVSAASVGGYVNYLEPGRPIASYYGTNFARLRRLRGRYDPNRLLRGSYVIPR
jgi:FAD/FMN-containing dehydrogenase